MLSHFISLSLLAEDEIVGLLHIVVIKKEKKAIGVSKYSHSIVT